MSVTTIFTLIAALCYFICGVAIVRSMNSAESKASNLLRLPIYAGLALHAYVIQGEMFRAGVVHFGFGFACSVTLFLAVVILLIESYIHRLHGQFGIILIAAAVGVLLPILFPGQAIPSTEWTVAFRWHLLFALAAYSFMAIATVQAVLMSIQNRQLKKLHEQPEHSLIDSLPGLVVMERIFFRIVAVGFICLTLVLVSGFIATKEAYGVFLHLDHKMILTWIAWFMFGVLLGGRYMAGWRAKTALSWFWIGMTSLVLAYLGYSFVLEIVR